MTRRVSISYIVAGTILLIVLLALALNSIRSGDLAANEAPRLIPDRTSDFIIARSLSPAQQQEARSLYESAQRLADGHALHAARSNRWNHYLQWAAFFLSSLIVVLAGAFGRTPSDETAQGLIKDLESAPPAPAPAPKKNLTRFAQVVGLVAALSAVANGAATRLQAGAVESRLSEQAVVDAVVKTSKITAQPTSESDVDAALEDLGRVVRDNPL
jgi:hypothetical protein